MKIFELFSRFGYLLVREMKHALKKWKRIQMEVPADCFLRRWVMFPGFSDKINNNRIDKRESIR